VSVRRLKFSLLRGLCCGPRFTLGVKISLAIPLLHWHHQLYALLCKNEPNIESGNKAEQLRTIRNSPQMTCLQFK